MAARGGPVGRAERRATARREGPTARRGEGPTARRPDGRTGGNGDAVPAERATRVRQSPPRPSSPRIAMAIDLYAWNTPNGRKISVALEEFGLPYRVVPVDIVRGAQHDPAFVAISPNARIPAIVDPDGPGGTPISVFESGAILVYLAEKTGRFLPTEPRARVSAFEWLMWQMGGFGPMPGQVHHFVGVQDEADRRYGLERYSKETRRLYGVADRRLAQVEWFAGDALSIADFAIVGWVWRHERHRVDLADFPAVRRWYDAMRARPAVSRGFEVALG